MTVLIFVVVAAVIHVLAPGTSIQELPSLHLVDNNRWVQHKDVELRAVADKCVFVDMTIVDIVPAVFVVSHLRVYPKFRRHC